MRSRFPEALEPRMLLAADFLEFAVTDASGDDSALTVFESSALSIDYDVSVTSGMLLSVDVFAEQNGNAFKIGEYTTDRETDQLISLDGATGLTGAYEVYATASTSDGATATSPSISVDVRPATVLTGNPSPDLFTLNASTGSATVYYGGGGTDTLSLNVPSASVVSLNGDSLAAFTPNSMVTSQAIYAGTAFDYLRLADGREVYFQGIERLSFSDSTLTELQTRTNDRYFDDQWNLAVADVPDAWRFTRGSEDVLLVSLDTGIPISNGVATFSDLASDRLSFAGLAEGAVHGHLSTSVMAATPNNGQGIAGINWESPVLVLDVYRGGSESFNTGVNLAMSHLASIPASRVVFQGGIQGESWLIFLDPNLIPSITEEALFAIAAGNGGQDISIPSHPEGFSAGIARLEADHENVLAVGGLRPNSSPTNVDGQTNYTSFARDSISNFGENLTFIAPTNVPAVRPDGRGSNFRGTSAANPNMAGFASLVWSIDPSLTAGELRQIMAETATDLGALGRDPQFGHGVPNVGAAVRQVWASVENAALVALEPNPLLANQGVTINRADTQFDYDLGPVGSTTASGFELISPDTNGDISWSSPVFAVDTQSGDPLVRDFIQGNVTTTLNHKVANGVWDVTIVMGDNNGPHDLMSVTAEGQLINGNINVSQGSPVYVDDNGVSSSPTSFQVTVTDGELNLEFDDQGGEPFWILNRLSLVRVDDLPPEPLTNLQFVVGRDGRALLKNDTHRDLTIAGYEINDSQSGLLPEGWLSLSDQQFGWTESNASTGTIQESGDAVTIPSGGVLYLDRVIDSLGMSGVTFDYQLLGGLTSTQGYVTAGDLELPVLPGDYNRDFTVDAADFTTWRDRLGEATTSFSNADGNGNGIVDEGDRALWERRFGESLQNTQLINATVGNGSFQDWGSLNSATRVVAVNNSASIPGWTVDTINAGGWLRNADSSATAGAASDGDAYLFAAGQATVILTSDPLGSYNTNVGDEFVVALDVASNSGSSGNYEISLFFNGQQRNIASFSDATQATTDGTTRYEFSYIASSSDAGFAPVLQIEVDPVGMFSQSYLDNLNVTVLGSGGSSSAPASTQVAPVMGDLSLDGVVDSIDLGRFLVNYADPSESGWENGDLNGDQLVASSAPGLLLNSFAGSQVSATSASALDISFQSEDEEDDIDSIDSLFAMYS